MTNMTQAKRLLFLLLILCSGSLYSQEAVKPRTSPLALITMRYKDTYVRITYSQPHKRGRQIFGKLVPYGEVWRTGANEATELTTTRDIIINGTLLPAGNYTLFTIPEKDKWTVIINKDVGLWGAYNYNPKMDALRFEVPVQQTDVAWEAFTMQFDQRNNVADLLLIWDTVKIVIPIQFIEPKL